MKLAYFSPLNPQPSGISDYSEELLPYLAASADITLFVDGFEPVNRDIRERFKWVDYKRNPHELQKLSSYDAIIYHLGNDHRYHAGMTAIALAHPGIIVFHDFALQDFFLGIARERKQPDLYLDELEACHGKTERNRAAEFLARGSEPPQATMPLEFPINCRLARSAEGIIVHSEWSRERLSKLARVPIARINHHITARAAATAPNEKRGDNSSRIEVASFGLITPEKGIERALAALAALGDEFEFHYTLVGSAVNYPDINETIKRFGLADRVTVTGHVALEEFERLMANTDIAINLRERAVGATSGSLCRIMAAAVPAIISNVGAFSELPNDAVLKIDHDRYADALLLAYLRALFADASLRQRIGANARRHVLAEHSIEASAAHYLDLISQVIKRRPHRIFLSSVADQISSLGINKNDEALLRQVASQVAVLSPVVNYLAPNGSQRKRMEPSNGGQIANTPTRAAQTSTTHISNSKGEAQPKPATGNNGSAPAPINQTNSGRAPKLHGIDYKRAAIDYLGQLSEERQHHLRTKPFYNLANKPAKYKGEGMDSDMHRHFCDFANIAVGLALPPGARILDVGCGSGWLSEYFARLGYQVTGVDISPSLIEMSRERVARVPYGVDHETGLQCKFAVHDIEVDPLPEKFDAIICYDSLHHFVDEHAVVKNLVAMLEIGGLLFVLEGHKPPAGSQTEAELRDVMREFGTLESPFDYDYLRSLLDQHGLAVVGDYVSVNGLFERQMLTNSGEDLSLPLRTLPTDYHYLTCMKVTESGPASSVPDSRAPGLLRAELTAPAGLPQQLEPETKIEIPIAIRNAGDTIWLNGQTVRAGMVMPGIRIMDQSGATVSELHGHPLLPRSVAPGQSVLVRLEFVAPALAGKYTARIDLVDQHVCWFEEMGSQPLVFNFEVIDHPDDD